MAALVWIKDVLGVGAVGAGPQPVSTNSPSIAAITMWVFIDLLF
jgi:hypothetical protein